MRVIVTTSRRPTQRIRSFLKDFSSIFPQVIRLNRGKTTLVDLASYAVEIGAERIIVITSKRGNPSSIITYAVDVNANLTKLHRIIISGVKLSREYGGNPCPRPSKICVDISSIKSELQEKLAEVLAKDLGFEPITSINDAPPRSIVAVINSRARTRQFPRETVLKFLRSKPEIACGPRLRIYKVIDYGHEKN